MSAITAYTSLTGRVALSVLGCPDTIINLALAEAGREFCKLSGSWQDELDVQNVTAYQTDYTLTHSYTTNALIDRVVWAEYNGYMLDGGQFKFIPTATFRFEQAYVPTTSTSISAYSALSTYTAGDKAQYNGVNYVCRATISTPEAFTATNWTRIRDGLYTKVAFRPTFDATYLPAHFFDRWAEAFVAGARASILRQSNAPWYNPRAAADEEHAFMSFVHQAKRETILEYKAGDPIMQIQVL